MIATPSAAGTVTSANLPRTDDDQPLSPVTRRNRKTAKLFINTSNNSNFFCPRYRPAYNHRPGPRGHSYPTTHTPRSASIEVPQSHGPQPTLDGFLIAALHNEADRQLVMALQTDIEGFLTNSQMTRLDFPPMNSYQRLLIHRVAQYFGLDHVVLSSTEDTRTRSSSSSMAGFSAVLRMPQVASPTTTTMSVTSSHFANQRSGSRPICLFKSDRAMHPGIRLELLIPNSEFTDGPCMVNRRYSDQDQPPLAELMARPRFPSTDHYEPMQPFSVPAPMSMRPHVDFPSELLAQGCPPMPMLSPPPFPFAMDGVPGGCQHMFFPMSPNGPSMPSPPPGLPPTHQPGSPTPMFVAWNPMMGQWVPVGPFPPHHHHPASAQCPPFMMPPPGFGIMSPMSPNMPFPPVLPGNEPMHPCLPPPAIETPAMAVTNDVPPPGQQQPQPPVQDPTSPPATPDLRPESKSTDETHQVVETYPSPPITPNVKRVTQRDQSAPNSQAVPIQPAAPSATAMQTEETSTQASHTHNWVRKFFPVPRYQGADTHVANSPPRPIHILHIIPPEGFPSTDLPHLLALASARLSTCTPITFKFRAQSGEIHTQYLLRFADPVAALGALSATAAWADMHVVQWGAKVAPAKEGVLPLAPKGVRKSSTSAVVAGTGEADVGAGKK